MAPRRGTRSHSNAGARSLRLTGGEWRGRKLSFAAADGLRPTLSQCRERLYNWLQFDIAGHRVLDAFAGSGILGLEALSRGAATVTFIELNRSSAALIRQHLETFGATHRGDVHAVDALAWMAQPAAPYDVVFLDPPFAGDLFQRSLEALSTSPCVRDGTLVYLETPREVTLQWPQGWTLHKEARKGSLHQRLLRAVPATTGQQDGTETGIGEAE